jgi:hypothetical protein
MRYIDPIGGPPAAGKRSRSSAKLNSRSNHTLSCRTNDQTNPKQHDGDYESPPKRMKAAPTAGSSSTSRTFGEEISTNNLLETKHHHRHASSSFIEATVANNSEQDDDAVSDCGTEVSSVAHLRGWLDEFGKKNKQHYVKNVAPPTKDELEKPVRPKVRPSFKSSDRPTPLPPAAANALVKRMVVDHSHSSSSSSGGVASVFRARSTPVMIRIKPTPAEDVQATNEGYASVAKLSKWLADDPTSTKKVKQLRRGANIIAKSRKFDKVLANVVVEERIPRDCVSRQKVLLQKVMSEDSADNDDAVSVMSMQEKKDWMMLGSSESGAASVSDKKKWLSSAFQKSDAATPLKPHPFASKARTEILTSTSNSRQDNCASLAKEKWRKRTPTKTSMGTTTAAALERRGAAVKSAVTVTQSRATTDSSSSNAPLEDETKPSAVVTQTGEASVSDDPSFVARDSTKAPVTVAALERRGAATNDSSRYAPLAERKPPAVKVLQREAYVSATTNRSEEHFAVVKKSQPTGDVDGRPATLGQSVEQDSTPVDFRLARELLVQRSKVNGNAVDVLSAVKRRKAKFEMLEKEARRKSAALGLLKPAWEESKEGYVKTYRADIAPKKDLDELP